MAEHTYSGFIANGMQGTYKILEYDLVDDKVESISKKVQELKDQEKKIRYMQGLSENGVLELEGNKILAKKLTVLLECYSAFMKKIDKYTNNDIIHSKSEQKRNENLDKLKSKIEEIKKREEAELAANEAEAAKIRSDVGALMYIDGMVIPGTGTAYVVNYQRYRAQIDAAIAENKAEISSCKSDLLKIENLRKKGTN